MGSEETLHPFASTSCSLHCPQLLDLLINCLSPEMSVLDFSYKWNCAVCGFLCQAVSFHVTFPRFIRVIRNVCLPLIPFHGWIIFRCMHRPQNSYPFPSWWTLGLFPLFAIMGKAAGTLCVHSFHGTDIFLSLDYVPRSIGSRLLSQVVTPCLTIWGTTGLFSTVAAPFSIPTSEVLQNLAHT